MDDRTVLGWREWVALPEFGIGAIPAKIDTGARSSALHVEDLRTVGTRPHRRVRFHVADREGQGRAVEAEVVDERRVASSSGHRSERLFVRTTLVVAGVAVPVELGLSSRHGMRYPMLVGRRVLARRFVVDVSRSWLGQARAGAKDPA